MPTSIRMTAEEYDAAVAEHDALLDEMKELARVLVERGMDGLPDEYVRRMDALAIRYGELSHRINAHRASE